MESFYNGKHTTVKISKQKGKMTGKKLVAIFAVTTKPFIVFTSNVFAILGLRSLYFVLAGAILYGSKIHQSRVQKMMGQPVSRAEIETILSD